MRGPRASLKVNDLEFDQSISGTTVYIVGGGDDSMMHQMRRPRDADLSYDTSGRVFLEGSVRCCIRGSRPIPLH